MQINIVILRGYVFFIYSCYENVVFVYMHFNYWSSQIYFSGSHFVLGDRKVYACVLWCWSWKLNFEESWRAPTLWYKKKGNNIGWFRNWKNWKNKKLWTFVCPISTFDIFDHFGHVLSFCYGKNSKLNFKNIKKYEINWKLQYNYLYV